MRPDRPPPRQRAPHPEDTDRPAGGRVAALSATATAIRSWEYRAIFLDQLDAVEDLASLGDEGWELVSVAVAYAYFKRSTDIRPSR